jgi:hypothetical protein
VLNTFVFNKKAIIKIDIEGFEVFAFESASLLFETFDIRIGLILL